MGLEKKAIIPIRWFYERGRTGTNDIGYNRLTYAEIHTIKFLHSVEDEFVIQSETSVTYYSYYTAHDNILPALMMFSKATLIPLIPVTLQIEKRINN